MNNLVCCSKDAWLEDNKCWFCSVASLYDEIPKIINDRRAFWVYNLIDYSDESAEPEYKNYTIHFYFKDPLSLYISFLAI